MKNWLGNIGWPHWECEQCVGQEYGQGCFCDYHGAYLPCDPHVPWYARVARTMYNAVYV